MFENFKRRRKEKAAARWGRWCANVMVIAFLAAKRKYKGVAPTYAWLARRALSNRNAWRQISDTAFLFEKTGEEVVITDEMNLLQVIHIVIDIEFGHEISSWNVGSGERDAYLRLAHSGADKIALRPSK